MALTTPTRTTEISTADHGDRGRLLGLLLVLGPPVIWIARIAISYILVPFACEASGALMIHLATGISLLLIGGLTGVAVQRWRDDRRTEEHGSARLQRHRFMTAFGLMSGVLFFLVVVAEGAMGLLIHPCVGS